jgi:hypothetical protein
MITRITLRIAVWVLGALLIGTWIYVNGLP